MKNTTSKPTLAQRAHWIRNLTAAELRIVYGGGGGVNGGTPQGPGHPHV